MDERTDEKESHCVGCHCFCAVCVDCTTVWLVCVCSAQLCQRSEDTQQNWAYSCLLCWQLRWFEH